MAEGSGNQAFTTDWAAADQLQPQFVNQMLTQIGMLSGGSPEGIYVTFGVLAPPVIVGTPELMKEQEERYNGKVPVQPVSRVFLTRTRTEELITLLQAALSQYDQGVTQSEEVPVDQRG